MMQTAEQNARAYFMQCGNNILQPEDPDEATAEILYMFFNRRSCIDEPFMSEGYTCREIGEQIGATDKQVAAMVSKARKFLKSRKDVLDLAGNI